MKTIGLLGGMSCESTALYCAALNEGVRERLGGLHSAQTLVYSVDFAEVEALQRAGRWEDAAHYMADGLKRLARGGADFAVIGSVTGQRDWALLERESPIPLVCVRDAACAAMKAAGVRSALLLGTRYTMEQDYLRCAIEASGTAALVPPPGDRAALQRIIYGELCVGLIRGAARETFYRIIADGGAAGADAALLGCTELPLLADGRTTAIPLFDIVRIHCEAALALAFG